MPQIARFETRGDGYERWRAWDPAEKRDRYLYIHQLLAISEGADPFRVFSDGRYHIHHKNGIRWDNRPENVEQVSIEDHYELTLTLSGSDVVKA